MKKSGFTKRYAPLRSKKGFKTRNSSISSKKPYRSLKWALAEDLKPRQILDGIVSNIVRLGSADSRGFVKCATCPSIKFWKLMQCGHFQKRGNTATRYDMRNLAPQCEDCNCFKDGKQDEFAIFIDEFYGSGTAKSLEEQARTIQRYFPYDQEILKLQAVLDKLVEEKDNVIHY